MITRVGDDVFLVDPNGWALYTRNADPDGESQCYDACSIRWPPVTLLPGESARVEPERFGEIGAILRADGSRQVTFDGKPLYYYYGDTEPLEVDAMCEEGWSLITPLLVEPLCGPPPPVSVRLMDGDSVTGQLGSWCFNFACSDSPAYPLDRLPKVHIAQPGAEIELVMPEGTRWESWRVAYAESIVDDSFGITLGSGGDPEAASDGFKTVSVSGPPVGSWGLVLTIQFADGDATYSWLAEVGD